MIKLYLNKFKEWLILIGGISSGVTTIYLVTQFLILHFIILNLAIQIFLIIIVLFAVVFLFAQFSKIRGIVNEKIISNDIKNKTINDRSVSKFDLKLIPKTTDFIKWVKLLSIRAKKWSSDSEISSYSFFYILNYQKNFGLSHSFGISFSSNQKHESLRIYVDSEYEFLSDSSITNSPKISVDYGEAPFYQKVPNWRKSVEFLYKRIEDKIDDSFTIKVTNGMQKKIFLYCDYTYGSKKINASCNGEFDGKELTLYNTKEKIKL